MPTTGWLMELINPLATTGVLFNRAAGGSRGGVGAANLSSAPRLGRLAFEGLALYPNGVLYYGDENRPLNGASGRRPISSSFPHTPGRRHDQSVSASPRWRTGTVYGLRLGKAQRNTDYGQGTNTGKGTWVPIVPWRWKQRGSSSADCQP